MPGGRVQPVILQKPTITVTHQGTQGKQSAEVARLAQLEEMRRRTIIAQQALVQENAQKMEQLRLEQKHRDDEILRRQHEKKLNETTGDELGRQQEADEELKRWQADGLRREKEAATILRLEQASRREQELLAERARVAAIEEEKKSSDDDLVVKTAEATLSTPPTVPVVTLPEAEKITDMSADAELAIIRERINGILNDATPSM
jgi:hypothetical protein